jgi:hypothetical protein
VLYGVEWVDLLSHLDLVIYTIKMPLVMYVNVKEVRLFWWFQVNFLYVAYILHSKTRRVRIRKSKDIIQNSQCYSSL